MEIKLELPGEKLVIKLWETLTDKGVGSLLTPWQAERLGKANNIVRRNELLMLAQAEKDAEDIRAGRKRFEPDGLLRLLPSSSSSSSALVDSKGRIEPTIEIESLAQVANQYNMAQEARKEINVSKAIIHAEEVLAQDPQTPPERPVEEDWLYSWREYAGRVSTDELQQLWGKILAGEVKSPGTYSFRTLEFLKGLSKDEAEHVSKLASFVIEGVILRNLKQHLDESGISFDLLLKMQELGLLSGLEAIGLTLTFKSTLPTQFLFGLRSNGKVLVVEHDDPTKVLILDVYPVTTIGKQLLGLGNFQPNLEYLRLVGKEFVKQGFTVNLADWVQLTESEGKYFNAEKIADE